MFARAILFTCVLSSLFIALHFLKTISYSRALSVTVYTVGRVAPPKCSTIVWNLEELCHEIQPNYEITKCPLN